MRTLKALLLTSLMTFGLAAMADGQLSLKENFKSSPAVIAGALVLAGLTNLDAAEISAMMTQVFQQHATMDKLALQAGCGEFVSSEQLGQLAVAGGSVKPGACFCTDDADIFDQWVAPVFTPTIGAPVSELFEPRKGILNGYEITLSIDRSGTVKGGLFKRALTNRMKYKIFIAGREHGAGGRQQFCNFNGRFRLFTSTMDNQYIGINIKAVGQMLKSPAALAFTRFQIRDGEISGQ